MFIAQCSFFFNESLFLSRLKSSQILLPSSVLSTYWVWVCINNTIQCHILVRLIVYNMRTGRCLGHLFIHLQISCRYCNYQKRKSYRFTYKAEHYHNSKNIIANKLLLLYNRSIKKKQLPYSLLKRKQHNVQCTPTYSLHIK